MSAYKREAVGSTPTAPTRSEHMRIFKKIDCGLKVVPLVQPEVFDSGRASNARGPSGCSGCLVPRHASHPPNSLRVQRVPVVPVRRADWEPAAEEFR